MKVKELMRLLSEIDPELDVYTTFYDRVNPYEEGPSVEEVAINPRNNKLERAYWMPAFRGQPILKVCILD